MQNHGPSSCAPEQDHYQRLLGNEIDPLEQPTKHVVKNGNAHVEK